MPPGQARMVDTWSDYTGCWADVYDDDHEEMQACEGIPDPSSALGLCRDAPSRTPSGRLDTGGRPQRLKNQFGVSEKRA